MIIPCTTAILLVITLQLILVYRDADGNHGYPESHYPSFPRSGNARYTEGDPPSYSGVKEIIIVMLEVALMATLGKENCLEKVALVKVPSI